MTHSLGCGCLVCEAAFSADCAWEAFLLAWDSIGAASADALRWDRARTTAARLEAARAVVAPQRPSMAEIKRQLADTIGCQARTVGNALRIHDQAAFDRLIANIINNATQIVDGMFDEALGEEAAA